MNGIKVNKSSETRLDRQLAEQRSQLNLSARRIKVGDLTIDEKLNLTENVYLTTENAQARLAQHKAYSHSNIDWHKQQDSSSARQYDDK